MAQVRLYLAGTTDYTLLKGPTGPLVYPAAHVWIYRALHALSEGGREVGRVQWVFGGGYLGALGVVMGVGGRGGVSFFFLSLFSLVLGWGMVADERDRHRAMFFRCWCCRRGCIVFLS